MRAWRTALRWADARTAAARPAAAAPDSIDALGTLGALAARAGSRNEAETATASLEHPPEDAADRAALWRARIAAQLGDREKAVGLLRDGSSRGVPLILTTHADSWLAPLHGYPPFEEMIKPKG